MRQTDYALRVLIYLGQRPARHCSVAEMSREHQVSHSHLTKVVHALVRSGYLESIRGRLGGVRLSRAPADINVGSVVRLMECDLTIVDCDQCIFQSACGLSSLFNQAVNAFLATLDRVSLSEILSTCQHPHAQPEIVATEVRAPIGRTE